MPDEIALKPLSGYDESIAKPAEKPYTLTWLEYASQNYKQIVVYRSTTGTAYTVPEGYILYVTALWCSIHHTSQGLFRWNTLEYSEALLLTCECSANTSSSNSMSLSTPLKFNEGTQIHSSVTGTGRGGFHGFLVKID